MTVSDLVSFLKEQNQQLDVLIFPDGESGYRVLQPEDISTGKNFLSKEGEEVLYLQ